MMDFVGKAKWDAWKKLEGTSKEDAQKKYVALLKEVSKAFISALKAKGIISDLNKGCTDECHASLPYVRFAETRQGRRRAV